MGSADDEIAGGVHVEAVAEIEVVEELGGDDLSEDLRDQLAHAVSLAFEVHVRDHSLEDGDGAAVFVAEGQLALGVRPQEAEVRGVGVAQLGESLDDSVGVIDWRGHVRGRLVACKAEHNSLVSSALFAGDAGGLVHSARDVRALAVQSHVEFQALRAEALGGLVVADFGDDGTHQLFIIQVAWDRIDFPGQDHQVRGGEGFAGHVCAGLGVHGGIQHGIGNLVADLVGVSLGDRLRGEQVIVLI